MGGDVALHTAGHGHGRRGSLYRAAPGATIFNSFAENGREAESVGLRSLREEEETDDEGDDEADERTHLRTTGQGVVGMGAARRARPHAPVTRGHHHSPNTKSPGDGHRGPPI
jgi:hypothetical protein